MFLGQLSTTVTVGIDWRQPSPFLTKKTILSVTVISQINVHSGEVLEYVPGLDYMY